MIRKISTILLISLSLIYFNCSMEPNIPAIIFDTDIGGDADDLGALAMLLANIGMK